VIKPEEISQGEVDVVGRVFNAPLVTKGWTWLPMTQLITWGIMVRETGRKHPDWHWLTRFVVGTLNMNVILGSEWCHNLAHAAAAKWVGEPVDCIRVSWGMPMLVYYDIEDPNVPPRHHIIRSLGGPLINAIFSGIGLILKRFANKDSPVREVIDTAVAANIFLFVAGMTPIPFLDGGTALKWSLVDMGQTLDDADKIIRNVNVVSGAVMGAGAVIAFNKRKNLLGLFLTCMAGLSFGVATRLFKEKKKSA